ncbi:MAG TPA: GAF domain-containing sensor histidine kinase, partial [Vicinamibacteria bacterium]
MAEAKALLFSSADCEASLVLAGRLAVPALADGCVVHLKDRGGVTRMLAAYHADELQQSVLQSLHRGRSEGPWEVFRTGKPELLGDAGTHYLARLEDPEEREFLERLELGSIVSVPMMFRKRPLGAFTLLTSRYHQRLTERDLALVQDLSQCAAAAVAYARALEEAERRARFNEDLLGAFAHNLRNYMGSAHIWLALLRSEALSSASRRAVERIDESLSATTGFLKQMVDLSRMFTGRLKLEKQNTDLQEIVDSVLKAAESPMQEKGLHLEAEIDRSLETLWADPYRLRQALEGLVANAIKFTPSGGTVRVRLERREGRARLEVEDTGVGIPAEGLAGLLLSLEQRGGVPTGLGLAIARCVAELHYGEMTGASEGEGRGSLFALEVPLDSPAAGPEGSSV